VGITKERYSGIWYILLKNSDHKYNKNLSFSQKGKATPWKVRKSGFYVGFSKHLPRHFCISKIGYKI
jgi:hypothetical protein